MTVPRVRYIEVARPRFGEQRAPRYQEGTTVSLEQLETAIMSQGAGLPDLRIDVEDSDGDLADLSAYTSCSAKVFDAAGDDVGVSPTTTGIGTGFQVSFSDADAESLPAGEYVVRAQGTSSGRTRYGKCRLQVLSL